MEWSHSAAASGGHRTEGVGCALSLGVGERGEWGSDRAGRMPLPPDSGGKRATDARDADDYQTMFAREAGAVAAPTAALHFTPALIEALAAAGIGHTTLTLHVGAGTFLPVKTDDTDDHKMHAESIGRAHV